MNIRTASLLALLVVPAATYAQSTFFSQWQACVSQTQSKQIGWNVHLITQYPYSVQVARADVAMQIAAVHTTTCRPMEDVA
jgi:hypothetical protein